MTSITIPNSVTRIGESAFCGCTGLKTVTLSDGVLDIGTAAFKGCDNLTNITIPDSVTSIGEDAFRECNNLKSVIISKSLKINKNSFPDCCTVYRSENGGIHGDNFAHSVTDSNTLYRTGDDVKSSSGKLPNSSSTVVESIGTQNKTNSQNSFFNNYYARLKETKNVNGFSIRNGEVVGYSGEGGNVIIPDGVTSVGEMAFFACNSIVSILIPDSVSSIGDFAFCACENLKEATIPNNCNVDIERAFPNNCTVHRAESNKKGSSGQSSQGTSITVNPEVISKLNEQKKIIEEKVKLAEAIGLYEPIPKNDECNVSKTEDYYISNGVLYNYNGKDSNVIIPSNVTQIGPCAFSRCTSLTCITIPESVTSIADGAFRACENLTSITIPPSVTSIGDETFANCDNIMSITIPSSVVSIGNDTFSWCKRLTSITIPSSVTQIGEGICSGCISLKTISVSPNNTRYTSIDGNLYSKDRKELIQYAVGKTEKTFVIPNDVVDIGNRSFTGCKSLTSVIIPSNVTSIGDNAFFGCSGITSITISNGVTYIGKNAFYSCSGLKSITIPKSVKHIGKDALGWCRSLESVTIPRKFLFPKRRFVTYSRKAKIKHK